MIDFSTLDPRVPIAPNLSRKERTRNQNAVSSGNMQRRSSSSLLGIRTGLALITNNGVKHDLVGILRRVGRVALVPVVGNGVGEDVAIAAEVCAADAAADFRVALQTVLCVLVPEVECAIAAGGGEGSVDGMEGDGVD